MDARSILYDNIHQEMLRKGGMDCRSQGKIHGRYLKVTCDTTYLVQLAFLHTSAIVTEEQVNDEKSQDLLDFHLGVISVLAGQEEHNDDCS